VTDPIETNLQTLIEKNLTELLFPSELELKLNLEELLKTMSFLQNDVKICHLGISPENIWIDNTNRWKLSGFIFATELLGTNQADTKNVNYLTKPSDSFISSHPNLKFSAPEVAE
jgi:hypothetical protein